MSTQAIAVERKLTKYFGASSPCVNESLNIAMRISVQSDASRVFQALTRPEYLETWITLPGDGEDSWVVAWQQGNSFRFDHYRDRRRDVMICGDYRICRRRKLLFTWMRRGDVATTESLVYIRLYGNFTSTILELHHRGIPSASEHGWQQEMWSLSLDRFSRLFGGEPVR